ncbi:GGDEF domain-containing protein [Kutzneria chonburiensis]|uniref:Diguanylate cyclase n=1 Tax=Kutzneria chonburiensis TaxID=1483604 RepID=A0ABV6MZR7_9PSEU|nr:GGDEF domain-containing protein [Kutzneria chonburiensis]
MVELATVLMLVATATLTPITSSSWLWFGLLLGASVIHLEAAQGIERIREVSAEGSPYTHMQSVWYFAGVLLLPLPLLALLIVLSFTHEWFRVFRGQAIAYRKVFSAATVVLAVGAGQLAFAAFFPSDGPPYAAQLDGPLGAVAVIVAGLAYRLVNYALVVGAIVASNPEQPARKALGHASDQLIIAASVGLGYAVGVFTVDRPWSMPILLVTVLALHMGLLLPQFRIAAHTDSKTGLVDAAWWSDRAADQLDRARRLARTVGVLMIDLDHFKEVNDCYGHLAGDQVLTAVAETVRHSVRSLDLVGRWGGEEFAVLVPAVGVDELTAAAERVRAAVQALTVDIHDLEGQDVTVNDLTVSIGAGVYPASGAELSDLLLAVDGALFQAKRQGRNRTVMASRIVTAAARERSA